MTARSSTCSAIFGYQSETQRPLFPYCLKVRVDAISVLFAVPIAVTTLPNEGGIGCPCNSFNFGFGSKRSIWLGPPSMNSQMIDLAVGAWCGCLADIGSTA